MQLISTEIKVINIFMENLLIVSQWIVQLNLKIL